MGLAKILPSWTEPSSPIAQSNLCLEQSGGGYRILVAKGLSWLISPISGPCPLPRTLADLLDIRSSNTT